MSKKSDREKRLEDERDKWRRRAQQLELKQKALDIVTGGPQELMQRLMVVLEENQRLHDLIEQFQSDSNDQYLSSWALLERVLDKLEAESQVHPDLYIIYQAARVILNENIRGHNNIVEVIKSHQVTDHPGNRLIDSYSIIDLTGRLSLYAKILVGIYFYHYPAVVCRSIRDDCYDDRMGNYQSNGKISLGDARILALKSEWLQTNITNGRTVTFETFGKGLQHALAYHQSGLTQRAYGNQVGYSEEQIKHWVMWLNNVIEQAECISEDNLEVLEVLMDDLFSESKG